MRRLSCGFVLSLAIALLSGIAATAAIPANNDYLFGVSCVATTSCRSVGMYSPSMTPNSDYTLTERWNGLRWGIAAGPNPSSTINGLRGVSCVTSNFCIAVGVDANGSLIEMWDGKMWSAGPSLGGNGLSGVSCLSANFCFAVGNSPSNNPHGAETTLIFEWNGTSWSVVPSPNEAGGDNILSGVSCSSTTFCTAVGTVEGVFQTLIEMWNGTAWSLAPSPDPQTYDWLSGTSCVSPSYCVAVGYEGAGRFPLTRAQTLIEYWDGHTWSAVSSPNQFATGWNELTGVSCSTAGFCGAVGSAYLSPHVGQRKTLIETWNGAAWSTVSSPNLSGRNFLESVSCVSSANCTAAGFHETTSSTGNEIYRTLIETWNGTSWATVKSPNV